MIGYLKGEITYHSLTSVILDIQGVGYEIRVSVNTSMFLRDKKQTLLHTYLHIKEDAHVLYGFNDPREKNLFLHLISVSGVGPNTAMVILSSMEVRDLEEAIVTGDINTLKSIKGIGQKSAERLVVELKDKIRKEMGMEKSPDFSILQDNTIRDEALAALVTLGIPKTAAEKSIQMILKKAGREISLEDLIRQALKSM